MVLALFGKLTLAIDICIECDASLAGWGAFCNGQSANGHWPTFKSSKRYKLFGVTCCLVGFASLCV